MTVSSINGIPFTSLSAIDGRTLSTLSAVNGQTIASAFSITWTGITGATESPTGVLTKTAADGWGNCGAVSVETEAGDARFTVYAEDYTKNYFLGIGADSSCNNFNTVDFGVHYNLNSAEVRIYKNGVGGVNLLGLGAQSIMIVTERIGTNFDYYYLLYTGTRPAPTDAGRTHWDGPTVGTGSALYVNCAMYFVANSVVDAANLLWEAI